MLHHAPLGSVYLGRDIRIGAKVALKIGSIGQSPSGLSHKYNVYLSIAGSTGTSSVLWYGKEGHYEVIVLEHLGNSLGNLINENQLGNEKVLGSFKVPIIFAIMTFINILLLFNGIFKEIKNGKINGNFLINGP